MVEPKGEASRVRISLIDVMYAVVLAYGFTFFDKAGTLSDYIRFVFAYVVIIIDWIYTYSLYRGLEYKYNSILIIDIMLLFTISRLFHSSSEAHSHYYWLWLSVLFALYVAWDIILKHKAIPSRYDWRYSIAGDLFATIGFFVIYILLLRSILQPLIWLHIIMAVVYSIGVRSWFKKLPQST